MAKGISFQNSPYFNLKVDAPAAGSPPQGWRKDAVLNVFVESACFFFFKYARVHLFVNGCAGFKAQCNICYSFSALTRRPTTTFHPRRKRTPGNNCCKTIVPDRAPREAAAARAVDDRCARLLRRGGVAGCAAHSGLQRRPLWHARHNSTRPSFRRNRRSECNGCMHETTVPDWAPREAAAARSFGLSQIGGSQRIHTLLARLRAESDPCIPQYCERGVHAPFGVLLAPFQISPTGDDPRRQR